MKKLLSLALIAFGLASAGTAGAQQETLKVGVSAGGPPLGGDESFFRGVIAAVAGKADFQVEFVSLPLAELLAAVPSGQIDVYAGPGGITEERMAMGIEFTEPFLTHGDALVIAATDMTPYRSLADLRGQPVGATAGATLYENAIRDSGAELKNTYTNLDETVRAIPAGEVKAVLVSAPAYAYRREVLNLYGETRAVTPYEMTIVQNVGLGVRRGETERLDKLNAALAELKADDTLSTLAAKWHLTPTP